MFDKNIERKCNSTQLAAHKSFRQLTRGFLGNNKRIIISPKSYKVYYRTIRNYDAGCLENPFLTFTTQFFFAGNAGSINDEQVEWFPQAIPKMELRCQGKWNLATMGDYCWFLCREDENSHKWSNHQIIELSIFKEFLFTCHMNEWKIQRKIYHTIYLYWLGSWWCGALSLITSTRIIFTRNIMFTCNGSLEFTDPIL